MLKRSILESGLILGGVLLVIASDDAPLCLTFSDGGKFCSATKVANGGMLSSVMNAVLQIPVEGRADFNPQLFKAWETLSQGVCHGNVIGQSGGSTIIGVPHVFSETLALPLDVPINTDDFDREGKRVFEFLNGPESLAKKNNFLYASAMDGIYEVDLKTGKERKIYDGNADCKSFCSRPLGIKIHDDTMFCADLLKGLVEIDLKTEKSKVLLPAGASVGGLKLSFPNDVAVDPEKHVIYLSDSDTKWGWNDYMFSLLEFNNNSRIIRYNLTSGEAEIFSDGLHFANGIQISNDKKSLLVNEFAGRRVVEFPFGGPLPVKGTQFTDYLPGNADNIRPSKSGGYWVALVSSRADGTRTLLEELQARPRVSKQILNWLVTGGAFVESVGALTGNKAFQPVADELKNGNVLGSSMPTSGAIAELDAKGKILRVLHSTKFGDLSEVLDDDGDLYVGSYLQKGVVKLPASLLTN